MLNNTYELKVIKPKILKQLFKERYSAYVDAKARPTERFVMLLCNGNDYMQNKIRATVSIVRV